MRNDSLRRASTVLLAIVLTACPSEDDPSVITDTPITAECLSEPCIGDACRDVILDGWCFVDGACWQAGQSPPGQLCVEACDPTRVQYAFIAPCAAGETCSGNNQCTAPQPDVPDAGVDNGTPLDATTDVPVALDVTGPDLPLPDAETDVPLAQDVSIEDSAVADVPQSDGSAADGTTAPDILVQDLPVDSASDPGTFDVPVVDVPVVDVPVVDVPTPDGSADVIAPSGVPPACNNAADQSICSNCGAAGQPACGDECPDSISWAQGASTDCGLQCIGDADAQGCTTACTAAATGLSTACAGCYGALILCTVNNCISQCIADPTSAPCLDCQEQNCLPEFNSCTAPPSPPQLGDPYSFATTLVLGSIAEFVPECGYDLDNDGDIDNGYSALAGGLGSILGDVDPAEVPTNLFISGQLAILFRWAGYDGPNDALVTAYPLTGAPASPGSWDFGAAQAGLGSFVVNPDSYDPVGSGLPKDAITGFTSNGVFYGASPGMDVVMFGLGNLEGESFRLSDVQFDGTLQETATGIAVPDGNIGGVLEIEDYAAGINAYIASECDCLGLPAGVPLIEYFDDATKPTCNAPDPAFNTCGPADDTCGLLTQFCSAIFLVISGDIDTDGNGVTKYDGLSVGLCLTAVGASVSE